MIKKFVSMATAAILFGTGLSVIAATPASATSPVISSTSTITAGQVNPTLVITSTSTFRANPDFTNANFSISAGGTNLTKSVITLVGNTITMALTGTARPGTLVLTASSAAFDPNPGTSANTLQFVVEKVPATNGAMSFTGMSSGVTTNASAPNSINGVSGEWTINSLITWSPALVSSRFAAGVVYTATFELIPTGGTFEGLPSSFFTFAGATSVSATYTGSPRTSAAVTIVFPATVSSITNNSNISPATTIKGASITNLGTPDSNRLNAVRGEICLTSAQASDTSGASITAISGVGANSFVPIQRIYADFTAFNVSGQGTSTVLSSTSVLVAGNILAIVIDAGPQSSSPTNDFKWYALNVAIGSCGGSTNALAAAFTAALAKAAEVVQAKAVLTTLIAGNKPANVQEFANADFKVRNNNVAEKVSAAMMKLSVADRENTQKVNEIINLEDFLDRVSVLDTRSTVRASELVSRGLLPVTSGYKHSVVRGLASYPSGSLDSLAKIEAAIKEQIFKAEAPKRRLAEIKAKIAARNK
jgi:hypothetical protein